MRILKIIWNDQVGSKVIGGLIVALILWGVSLISPEFAEWIKSLWKGYHQAIITAVVYTLILIVCYFLKKKKSNRHSFLKYTSIKNVEGYDWTWNWKYNKSIKKYQITDICPICKQCGEPLVFGGLYSSTYKCRNNHSVSSMGLNIIQSHNIIINSIKRKYPSDIDAMDFSNH